MAVHLRAPLEVEVPRAMRERPGLDDSRQDSASGQVERDGVTLSPTSGS